MGTRVVSLLGGACGSAAIVVVRHAGIAHVAEAGLYVDWVMPCKGRGGVTLLCLR